eukprot:6471544-Amphidinium_carterae.2
MTDRPNRNGGKEVKCRFGGKDFAATPREIPKRLLLTESRRSTLQMWPQPIEEEVFVQPPKEFYHNRPSMLWSMKKALYGLRTSPKQWQEHLSTTVY